MLFTQLNGGKSSNNFRHFSVKCFKGPVQTSILSLAEHSLVGCESLLFIGVLLKTPSAGIKLKFGEDKIYLQDITLVKR